MGPKHSPLHCMNKTCSSLFSYLKIVKFEEFDIYVLVEFPFVLVVNFFCLALAFFSVFEM